LVFRRQNWPARSGRAKPEAARLKVQTRRAEMFDDSHQPLASSQTLKVAVGSQSAVDELILARLRS